MQNTIEVMKHIAANNYADAIRILYSSERRHSVILYSTNRRVLDALVDRVYTEIKTRNQGIEDINKQMLPANPYYWDDIDGCTSVCCAEVSMDTFEKNADKLAVFTGWDYSVLTKPDSRKPLNIKATASLAMLGSLMLSTLDK